MKAQSQASSTSRRRRLAGLGGWSLVSWYAGSMGETGAAGAMG